MCLSFSLSRGVRNSHIYFDSSVKRWRLQSLRHPTKFLDMAEKKTHVLPIGTHDWAVGADVALCDKDPPEEIELTFSRCYPDMYSCDSGDCIPLR